MIYKMDEKRSEKREIKRDREVNDGDPNSKILNRVDSIFFFFVVIGIRIPNLAYTMHVP